MFDLSSPAAVRLRRARWSDPRLLVGLILVAFSIVVGSRVVASADDTRSVWSLTRDLVAGTTLTSDDLTFRQVRLDGDSNPYLAVAGEAPVGAVLRRDLAEGELLPAAALSRPGAQPEGLVTVPVGRDRLPLGLAAGQRVDVYVSVAPVAAGKPGHQVLAIGGARVDQVEDAAGRYAAGAGQGRVVLAVPAVKVQGVLAAVNSGSVDLVLVP
jgi:hypothetical protein